MKRYFLILIIVIAYSKTLYGQLPFELKIGQSSDNSYTQSKEGQLIGVFNANDTIEDTWQADIYMALVFGKNTNWNIGGTFELHRNTVIEKKQNVRQFGITGGYNFSVMDNSNNLLLGIETSLTFKDSQDKENDKNTRQMITGVSFNKVNRNLLFLNTTTLFPASNSDFSYLMRFSHDHNLGTASLFKDEKVTFVQMNFDFNVYLLSHFTFNWFQKHDFFYGQFNYTGRKEVLGSSSIDTDNLRSLALGINYSFGTNNINNAKISYSWINGADPLKGLANQRYETIRLAFFLNL